MNQLRKQFVLDGSTISVHQGDLPAGLQWNKWIAVDTEAMGLNPIRDRLCLVQISSGDGTCHLVQINKNTPYPNLAHLLHDAQITKIFHFARFDVAVLKSYLGIDCMPLYCTKIASRLARTYTDRHGLRTLCRDLLGIDISKQQQASDWGQTELTAEQLKYAAHDVLHLHALRHHLDEMLLREGRTALAKQCFAFLPTRVELDLAGWRESDVFSH